jgi:hypothetical protein
MRKDKRCYAVGDVLCKENPLCNLLVAPDTIVIDVEEKQRASPATGSAPRSGEGAPHTGERHLAGQGRQAAVPRAEGLTPRVVEDPAGAPTDREPEQPARPIPLGIVIARIFIVSSMGIAAALAIFLLVGGLWELSLIAVVATLVFLFLMFFVESWAESI